MKLRDIFGNGGKTTLDKKQETLNNAEKHREELLNKKKEYIDELCQEANKKIASVLASEEDYISKKWNYEEERIKNFYPSIANDEDSLNRKKEEFIQKEKERRKKYPPLNYAIMQGIGIIQYKFRLASGRQIDNHNEFFADDLLPDECTDVAVDIELRKTEKMLSGEGRFVVALSVDNDEIKADVRYSEKGLEQSKENLITDFLIKNDKDKLGKSFYARWTPVYRNENAMETKDDDYMQNRDKEYKYDDEEPKRRENGIIIHDKEKEVKDENLTIKEFKKNFKIANSIVKSYLQDDEYERNVCIMRGLDDLEYSTLNREVRSLQYDSNTGWVKQYTDAEVEERLKRIEKEINEKIYKDSKGGDKIHLMIIGDNLAFAETKNLKKDKSHIRQEDKLL